MTKASGTLTTENQNSKRRLEIERAVAGLRIKESKVALMTLSFYVDGALEQWERIKKDEDAAGSESALSTVCSEKGDKSKEAEHDRGYWAFKHQALLDAHFYFVCADKVFKLSNFIVNREKSDSLNKFWKVWMPKLERLYKPRRNLEHPEMYLQPGWQKPYFEFFFEKSFAIRGKRFDMSSSGLKTIADFFDELIALLESLEPGSKDKRAT